MYVYQNRDGRTAKRTVNPPLAGGERPCVYHYRPQETGRDVFVEPVYSSEFASVATYLLSS